VVVEVPCATPMRYSPLRRHSTASPHSEHRGLSLSSQDPHCHDWLSRFCREKSFPNTSSHPEHFGMHSVSQPPMHCQSPGRPHSRSGCPIISAPRSADVLNSERRAGFLCRNCRLRVQASTMTLRASLSCVVVPVTTTARASRKSRIELSESFAPRSMLGPVIRFILSQIASLRPLT
jgi:hypothetical protein